MKPTLILGDIIEIDSPFPGESILCKVTRITIQEVYATPTDPKHGDFEAEIKEDEYQFISRTLNPKAILKPLDQI